MSTIASLQPVQSTEWVFDWSDVAYGVGMALALIFTAWCGRKGR